ncbi:MAG: hypothetical protein E4G92_06590, partial [Bacteroidia bacterium]
MLLTVLSSVSFMAIGQTGPGETPLKLQPDPLRPWEASKSSPLFLNNPSNITTSVEYDGKNNQYIIFQKAGNLDFRKPVYMNPDEYRKYEFEQAMREY